MGGDARRGSVHADSLYRVGSFLGIAGLFALAVGIFYASTNAMRTGLLTRFWATLGMALSVMAILTPIFGPIGLIGLFLWTLLVALKMSGRWPGDMPPAWDAGEAVPWPQPGDAPPPGAFRGAREPRGLRGVRHRGRGRRRAARPPRQPEEAQAQGPLRPPLSSGNRSFTIGNRSL